MSVLRGGATAGHPAREMIHGPAARRAKIITVGTV